MGKRIRVGAIIRWNNFPRPRYSTEVKPRWFVCLGNTSTFLDPLIFYLSTTTTQTQQYAPGGSLWNAQVIHFKCGEYGFDRDCVLNLDEYYSESEESIDTHAQDIEIVSVIQDKALLKRIYNIIYQSRKIPTVVKRDIYIQVLIKSE